MAAGKIWRRHFHWVLLLTYWNLRKLSIIMYYFYINNNGFAKRWEYLRYCTTYFDTRWTAEHEFIIRQTRHNYCSECVCLPGKSHVWKYNYGPEKTFSWGPSGEFFYFCFLKRHILVYIIFFLSDGGASPNVAEPGVTCPLLLLLDGPASDRRLS